MRLNRCLAAGLLLVSGSALAQGAFPSKPMTFIVPFAPGGATDLMTRSIAQKMSESMGQPVIVENRPGANAIVGSNAVAKASPDGYTFVMCAFGHATNPYLGWVMAISLFSLGGIPPTAGFFGKMFLVTAGAEKANYLLIAIAVMNMVISLFYYLRVVKAIFIDKNDKPIAKLSGSISMKLALAICLVGVITTGFASQLFEYIHTITGK